jgi:hypothetical protein
VTVSQKVANQSALYTSSNPQQSIPNSTLAAPSKSDHRQCGGGQHHVFVQHHVAATLPMIPKDFGTT